MKLNVINFVILRCSSITPLKIHLETRALRGMTDKRKTGIKMLLTCLICVQIPWSQQGNADEPLAGLVQLCRLPSHPLVRCSHPLSLHIPCSTGARRTSLLQVSMQQHTLLCLLDFSCSFFIQLTFSFLELSLRSVAAGSLSTTSLI